MDVGMEIAQESDLSAKSTREEFTKNLKLLSHLPCTPGCLSAAAVFKSHQVAPELARRIVLVSRLFSTGQSCASGESRLPGCLVARQRRSSPQRPGQCSASVATGDAFTGARAQEGKDSTAELRP